MVFKTMAELRHCANIWTSIERRAAEAASASDPGIESGMQLFHHSTLETSSYDEDHTLKRAQKRLENLAKQDPGQARQKR